jgi:hypothetical protein
MSTVVIRHLSAQFDNAQQLAHRAEDVDAPNDHGHVLLPHGVPAQDAPVKGGLLASSRHGSSRRPGRECRHVSGVRGAVVLA